MCWFDRLQSFFSDSWHILTLLFLFSIVLLLVFFSFVVQLFPCGPVITTFLFYLNGTVFGACVPEVGCMEPCGGGNIDCPHSTLGQGLCDGYLCSSPRVLPIFAQMSCKTTPVASSSSSSSGSVPYWGYRGWLSNSHTLSCDTGVLTQWGINIFI